MVGGEVGRASGAKVNAFDILFYLVFFLASFVIAVSWRGVPDVVSGLMTGISFGILILAILAVKLDFLQGLKVVTPTWLIGSVTLLLWVVFNAVLPFGQASAASAAASSVNVLVQILGPEWFNFIF